ncbi:MAG TPA: helix-turn-helix domain-containing protein [Microbacteriaceae bacterium]|nr:helix-turn-helix domain-containing protein [Microbacteriaceae bacterium]
MPHEIGRLLTVADVADILNLSIAEVTALIADGELPAIRISSGMWRIEREVLRGYIDGKYEESRRAALWVQAAFVDLPEITSGSTASIRQELDPPD